MTFDLPCLSQPEESALFLQIHSDKSKKLHYFKCVQNVARLTLQSELNLSISLICLNSTTTKTDSLYIPWGTEYCLWSLFQCRSWSLVPVPFLVLGSGRSTILGSWFWYHFSWYRYRSCYSCGLTTATIEYSCPSVCVSVCLSVCVCLCTW